MGAVMTIFEGTVPEADRPAVQDAWAEIARNRPEQLLHGWLVQKVDDESVWCAVELWRSREDFAEYEASVAHLPANLMFRSLGVTPVLAAFAVAEDD
jgi:hypothetical protein